MIASLIVPEHICQRPRGVVPPRYAHGEHLVGLQDHEGLDEMFDAQMFRQCASTSKSLRDLCAQLVCN